MATFMGITQESYADQPPELTPPPSLVTTEAEGFLTPVLILEPQSWPDDLEYVTNYVPYFIVGNTTVAWHIPDYRGKPLVFTTTVVVLDTTPPEFTSARDQLTANSKNGKKAPVYFEIPTANDIADPDVDVFSSHKPGSKFPVGNTTVVFTAVDDSGNTATHEMTVTVKYTKIEGLKLERTHNSIRATWTQFEDHTRYGLVLLDADTKQKIQDVKIRGTSHTFSYLEPVTDYIVQVHVQDKKYVRAKMPATTLPPVILIKDSFSTSDGWVFRANEPHVSGINPNVGNPAPSLELSGPYPHNSIRYATKNFSFSEPLGNLYLGVQFMLNSTNDSYSYIEISVDGKSVYVNTFWNAHQGNVWHSSLNDISRFVEGSRNIVAKFILNSRGGDNPTIYYDNLYLSTAPPSNFRGGSADPPLTPEQENFDAVLLQILEGDLDPYLYINGTRSLDHYNDYLLDLLDVFTAKNP